MNLLLFSFDAVTDTDLPEKKADLETALQRLDELGPVENSFLGFTFSDESSIQFMYQDNGDLLVDVPDPERGGSLQKTVNFDECRELIQQLYAGKSVESIPGLKFQEW